MHCPNVGTRGGAFGWGTALRARRSRVRFPMVSLDIFSLTRSCRPHYGTGVDSASNRNEYQECFLVVKAAGAWGWQLTTFMCRLSWNLGASTSRKPQGLSRPVMGLLFYCPTVFPFFLKYLNAEYRNSIWSFTPKATLMTSSNFACTWS